MANLKERLVQKKKDIKASQQKGMIRGIKEGTTRARPIPTGEEKDFAMEVHYIFLSKDLGGFVSPVTFGKRCAFAEKVAEMEKSKKESDRKFAKEKLTARKKYLMPHLLYNDVNGKEPDSVRLMLLSGGLYNELIDLYLDGDEAGDFTDPINGYDIKYTREGSGKMDTRYSCRPCKPTKLAKEFRKPVDLEEMVKSQTPTYRETKELLDKFMNSGASADDEDDQDSRKSRLAAKKKKKSRDM